MEGGEKAFEPVSLSDLDEVSNETVYSMTLEAPSYTGTEFDGPGVNWTGQGTYIMEASLVLEGKGPKIRLNMSAERGKMWYEVPSRSYQDEGREALRTFSELFEVSEKAQGDEVYSWDDFAGYPEVKESIRQDVVWPIENPDLFDRLGVDTSHVLLYGPPGTGKTLLGNVIADETDSMFYEVTAGDVINS